MGPYPWQTDGDQRRTVAKLSRATSSNIHPDPPISTKILQYPPCRLPGCSMAAPCCTWLLPGCVQHLMEAPCCSWQFPACYWQLPGCSLLLLAAPYLLLAPPWLPLAPPWLLLPIPHWSLLLLAAPWLLLPAPGLLLKAPCPTNYHKMHMLQTIIFWRTHPTVKPESHTASLQAWIFSHTNKNTPHNLKIIATQ